MFRCTLILVAFITLFTGCSESDSPRVEANNEISITKIQNITNEDLLMAINKVRKQTLDCNDGLGLVGPFPSLTWNEELFSASLEHANDLAQSNTFSHDGSGTAHDITGSNNGNKSSFAERIRTNGYVEYQVIGENVAAGYETIDQAISAWLTSPDHCANIMRKDFTEMGMSISINEDADYKVYWIQNFGSK